MIKRTFDITTRIEQGQIPFCFQCVQGDKDVYALHIRITEGDKEIDYTQVSDATITFALANGAVVQSDPTRLTVSATGITYQMGTSEISCPGKVLASIQLFGSSGERLTTARFQFEVVADLISPKAVQSESHFPLLQQLVADVEQLKQDIVDLQIPDGSIMDEKLSNAAGQIKQRFASHKADKVTDSDGAHGLKVESGTFTPTIIGHTTTGNNTYSSNYGFYEKIGRTVIFHIFIMMTAKDPAMEGIVHIAGLPFVAYAQAHRHNSVSIASYSNIVTAGKQLGGFLQDNKTTIEIVLSGDNITAIPLSASDINNNTVIRLSGMYQTF